MKKNRQVTIKQSLEEFVDKYRSSNGLKKDSDAVNHIINFAKDVLSNAEDSSKLEEIIQRVTDLKVNLDFNLDEPYQYRQAGIYAIYCPKTYNFYVGRTSRDFKSRWKEHLESLHSNTHSSKPMQDDWNQYGASNFFFGVLQVIDKKEFPTGFSLEEIETTYIDYLKPGYNQEYLNYQLQLYGGLKRLIFTGDTPRAVFPAEKVSQDLGVNKQSKKKSKVFKRVAITLSAIGLLVVGISQCQPMLEEEYYEEPQPQLQQ